MGDDGDKGPEHRQHRRFPVDWRVTLRIPESGHESRVAASNASRGGVFVLTARPPPSGTLVELDIELPDGPRTRLVGTVQHVVTPERAIAEMRPPGIGVRIDDRHAMDLLILEEMAMAAETTPPPRFERPAPRPPPAPVARIPIAAVAAARVVGIDLGSSATRLACAVGERVVVASDEEGRAGIPSIASYPPGGEPQAGFAARYGLLLDPRRTVTGIKRLLGRPLADAGEVLQSVGFPAVAGPDGDVHVDLDGETVSMVDAAATLLRHVREVGERSLRRAITAAVLTCPPGAGPPVRDALRRAAAQAGLEAVELLEDPVAAARAHGVGRAGPETAAVYDFAADRFVFSIVEISGARGRVLVSEEDPHIGGDDLDEALADHVANQFWRETRVELRQSLLPWRRLLLASEEAKRILSVDPAAMVELRELVVLPERLDLVCRLERAHLEAPAQKLAERSLALCARVLERGGLAPTSLGRVLAVGGTSCVPAIRHALEQFLGRPPEVGPAPEEAVVIGAARAGATRSA